MWIISRDGGQRVIINFDSVDLNDCRLILVIQKAPKILVVQICFTLLLFRRSCNSRHHENFIS